MKSIRIYVLLSLIIWLAHFLFAHEFGLYEDDYYFISPPFGWDLNKLSIEILNNFETWPQGRPIGFSLPILFSFIGYNLGGLYGIYLIAFLILSLNACLVYTLVKMIASDSVGLMAGLAFSLFPPDTTRSFLMHATGLQPSLTFLLLASLCYLSGRTKLSYLIIIGSLLTYESPFMVFWGIPLLLKKWDRKFVKELVRHFVVLGVMLLCVYIIRRLTGDDRIQMGTESFFIPIKVIASMIIGPLATAGLSLFMPFKVLFYLDVKIIFSILVSLILIAWIFSKTKVDYKYNANAKEILMYPWLVMKLEEWKVPPDFQELVRISLVSIVLLCLGYVFSFTHFPPIAYHGRLTSVHLAASLGSSILFACLGSILVLISDQHLLKYSGVAALVVYFSFAVGYGVFIQEDFVRSWCAQKDFWAMVLPLIPDLEDGTVIFFPYDDLTEPEYIHVHSWADPIVLEQIYDFPADWQAPPRLFSLESEWKKLIYLNDQQLVWEVPGATWAAHTELLPSSNLILLQTLGQSMTRLDGNIPIQDQEIIFKPIPLITKPMTIKEGPLYALFITNNNCNQNKK